MARKFFHTYLIVSSFLMILYVVVSLINTIGGRNIAASHEELQRYSWLFHSLGYLFFFCFANIVVCGVSGLYLIFVKEARWLGFLCLIASVSFFLMARQIGDAFQLATRRTYSVDGNGNKAAVAIGHPNLEQVAVDIAGADKAFEGWVKWRKDGKVLIKIGYSC